MTIYMIRSIDPPDHHTNTLMSLFHEANQTFIVNTNDDPMKSTMACFV